MHLNRRTLGKLSLATALPLGLAACAGQSNLDTGSGDAADKPIVTAYNGAAGGFTKNFNPHSPSVVHMVQGCIYESLFYFNPLEAIDQEPLPILGETYSWNEDGTELTITTRSGVTWSDGTAFTAKDVAFTFNKLAATESLNPSGEAPTAEAPDETTAVITYPKPAYAEGPNALGRTWIVPEHLFSEVEDIASYANEEPVGTGPFTLADFTPESYLMTANTSYWEAGKPAIGGVRCLSLSGNQAASDKWLAGEIDYMGGALPNLDEYVAKNKDLAYTNTGLNQVVLWAASNPELGCTGPQTDVAVRRALYYGMDREQLSSLAFFGLGGPISPSFALAERDRDYIDPSIEDAPWTADTAKAQQVLEEAGYAKGADGIYAKDGERVSLTISCPTGWADYVTALDTLQEQYKKVGIELVPQQVSVNEWNDAKATGKFQLVIDGIGQGPAPDPYYPYRTYFDSANTVPVGENGNPYQNVTRFSDPDVDAALDAASETDDIEEKKKQYAIIQDKLATNLPAIPVMLSSGLTEYNTSKVTGWPTEENMYAYPLSWSAPDSAIVLKTVTPVE